MRSRRQFIAAVAITANCASSDLDGQDDVPNRLIDAHSHIWSRDVKKYPLADGKSVADLKPASFTAEELLALGRTVGVTRVVLIQHRPYHGWDNTYLLDSAARYPEAFRVVAMVDDSQPNPGAVMRALREQQVTGFRITPSNEGLAWLEGAGMQEMWQTAAETGQNICCLINPQNLPQLDAQCQRYPETPVVIDHFARIGIDGEFREVDLAALSKLARHRRVRVKASAYYALGKRQPPYLDLLPMLRRTLDEFGVERIMWASDAPYQTVSPHHYADSIALVREHAEFLTNGDRDWLLRRTAAATFWQD